jgi:hypothetical protein
MSQQSALGRSRHNIRRWSGLKDLAHDIKTRTKVCGAWSHRVKLTTTPPFLTLFSKAVTHAGGEIQEAFGKPCGRKLV